MTSIGGRVADALVSVYQRRVSPGLNAQNDTHCIYTPSCSAYALEAVTKEGALMGSLDTLARLARCNSAHAERHREAWIQSLSDNSACVEYADAEAAARAGAVRTKLSEAAALGAAGDADGASEAGEEARELLRSTLHVGVEDRPGQHDHQHFTISVEHRPSTRARQAAVDGGSVTPRAGIGVAARAALGAAAGGLLGGVVGGVCESILTGLVLAPMSAFQKTDVLHAWLAPRVGGDGADALVRLAGRATMPAGATARLVHSVTGSRTLAGVCALAVGVPLGLAGGLIHGVAFGGFWGSRAGRAA